MYQSFNVERLDSAQKPLLSAFRYPGVVIKSFRASFSLLRHQFPPPGVPKRQYIHFELDHISYNAVRKECVVLRLSNRNVLSRNA